MTTATYGSPTAPITKTHGNHPGPTWLIAITATATKQRVRMPIVTTYRFWRAAMSAPAPADAVVMVTSRLPEESLFHELADALGGAVASVRGIGDAWSPGTIAAAVWSGRRYAEEFDAELPPNDEVPFRREVTQLAPLAVTD